MSPAALMRGACERVLDLREKLLLLPGHEQIGPRAAADEVAGINEAFQQAREDRPGDKVIRSAARLSQVLTDGFNQDDPDGFIWGGGDAQQAGEALTDFCEGL